jgi:hypothetical protein
MDAAGLKNNKEVAKEIYIRWFMVSPRKNSLPECIALEIPAGKEPAAIPPKEPSPPVTTQQPICAM